VQVGSRSASNDADHDKSRNESPGHRDSSDFGKRLPDPLSCVEPQAIVTRTLHRDSCRDGDDITNNQLLQRCFRIGREREMIVLDIPSDRNRARELLLLFLMGIVRRSYQRSGPTLLDFISVLARDAGRFVLFPATTCAPPI